MIASRIADDLEMSDRTTATGDRICESCDTQPFLISLSWMVHLFKQQQDLVFKYGVPILFHQTATRFGK